MVVLLIMLVMDISTSSVTSISMSCGQDGGVYGVADDDGVVSSSLISISMASAPSLIFIISGLWCGWCCRRWWWWMLLKSDLHHIPIKRHLHFCLAWVFSNSTEKWIERLVKFFFFGCTISNLSQTRLVYNCAQIGKGEYLIWEGEELWPILKGQRKWKLVGHSWIHLCWHHAVSFLVKISKSILQTVCFSFNSWLFEVLSLINLWLNLKLKNEMIRDSHQGKSKSWKDQSI